MRLRKFEPNEEIDDIVVNESELYADPDAVENAQKFNENQPANHTPTIHIEPVETNSDSDSENESERGNVLIERIPFTRELPRLPLRETVAQRGQQQKNQSHRSNRITIHNRFLHELRTPKQITIHNRFQRKP